MKDFLYPVAAYTGNSGREVTLYKTSLFNPIRITVSVYIYIYMAIKMLSFSTYNVKHGSYNDKYLCGLAYTNCLRFLLFCTFR